MRTDLGRYRIMAVITGVVLLVATFIAIPLTYVFDRPTFGKLVWTVHGWFYLLYLMAAVQLAFRLRWPLVRTGIVLLAGTVPFLSFVMERRITREAAVSA